MNPNSNCRDFDQWVGGDLEAERQILFEQHLPQCKSCQALVQRWRELELDVIAAELLFTLEDSQQEPEPQTVPSPLSKSDGAQQSKRARRFATILMSATTASILLVSVLAWRFQQQQTADQQASVHFRPTSLEFVCPPGVPCIPVDPLDLTDAQGCPMGLPFEFESSPRIGICLTGQVCVLPSAYRWP